jgi:dTDP-D-glucose 4,6-dehydratase
MAGIAWRPATAFDDGLAATLAWYRDKGQAAA